MSAAKTSKQKNHERAPISAEFVRQMREVFGADQVKVIYVKEGDFELGSQELGSPVAAAAAVIDVPLPRSREEAGADARGYAQAQGEVA